MLKEVLMKIRVHEMAKKYSIKNKEFLEILKKIWV